jgi:hypothetical protein
MPLAKLNYWIRLRTRQKDIWQRLVLWRLEDRRPPFFTQNRYEFLPAELNVLYL